MFSLEGESALTAVRGSSLVPKFDEDDLIPRVTQLVQTMEVLLQAYMNFGVLEATLMSGQSPCWSQLRRKLSSIENEKAVHGKAPDLSPL